MSWKIYGRIMKCMTSTADNIIIVGGGAAGMLAGIYAAESSKKVILIEKNKMLGRKLRITGKGRCNITNSADISDFFKSIPVNSKFLYSALYSYTNDDIVSLLEAEGVKTKEERGGRIFPISDNAHQVADALERLLRKKGASIVRDEVTEILCHEECVQGVKTKLGKIYKGKVILATGGVSYPLTGSDGKGHEMSASLGHTVTKLKGSLVPVVSEEKWVHSLAGLSLKNVNVTVKKGSKTVFSDIGEMLFTHFGLSGPLILSASSHMRDVEKGDYKIYIDLKPALDEKKLDSRILRDFEEELNRDLINGLDKLLPKTLIPVVIENSGLDGRKKINSITKAERQSLVNTIKGLALSPTAFRPVKEAIITSGGIKVSEINPSTMESKLIKGLYFAGEIIDVDAYTGGYNLQIAWSTGYLAGVNASSDTL